MSEFSGEDAEAMARWVLPTPGNRSHTAQNDAKIGWFLVDRCRRPSR